MVKQLAESQRRLDAYDDMRMVQVVDDAVASRDEVRAVGELEAGKVGVDLAGTRLDQCVLTR